jgi:uncharacterized protein YtpQ (UPF0354 family)
MFDAAQGFTEDQLHEVGLANLAEAVDGLEVKVHRAGSAFAVIVGGNHEAILLLLDGFWEGGFRQLVTGTYAAAVPARDVLVFADAEDTVAVAEPRAVIGRVWPTGDHLLSDCLFTLRDGAWKVLPM